MDTNNNLQSQQELITGCPGNSLSPINQPITADPCNYSHHTTPQPFYGPCSGTTRVSRCQKRTSGLYGARGD